MASYTPEEVKKRFESLPADIKEFVYGTDMTNILHSIGAKHQLHIDQIGELEGEAADVMTGFSQPEEFISNLKESLNIDDAKAQAIAKDINDQLFSKIRESMKRASAPAAPTAPSAPPAVSMSVAPKMPPAAPAPKMAPPPAPAQPAVAPAPAPMKPKPDLSGADALLQGKTVSSPATQVQKPATPAAPAAPGTQPAPQKPQSYSADPYREPPLP